MIDAVGDRPFSCHRSTARVFRIEEKRKELDSRNAARSFRAGPPFPVDPSSPPSPPLPVDSHALSALKFAVAGTQQTRLKRAVRNGDSDIICARRNDTRPLSGGRGLCPLSPVYRGETGRRTTIRFFTEKRISEIRLIFDSLKITKKCPGARNTRD